MKTRAALTAALKAAVKAKGHRWHFVTSARNVDRLSTVAVLIRQQSIRKAPEAPAGAHWVTFTVTVVDPKTAWDAAEASLDDHVDDILHALDGNSMVRWTSCDKVAYQDFLAYDIHLDMLSGKD